MKKYVLFIVVIILLSFNCYGNTDLSKLSGKQIYRDVPAKNETEYDESYQGNMYKLVYYNEFIMQIKSIGFQGNNKEIFGEFLKMIDIYIAKNYSNVFDED